MFLFLPPDLSPRFVGLLNAAVCFVRGAPALLPGTEPALQDQARDPPAARAVPATRAHAAIFELKIHASKNRISISDDQLKVVFENSRDHLPLT